MRQGLASLPASEEEIIAELRSHLFERDSRGSTGPLAGFETSAQLAADFVAEYALRGAMAQGIFWALFIAARDSALGLLVLFPLLILQLSALLMLLAVALKPFFPNLTGWWVGGGRFQVGIASEHVGMREVLGWWGIPVLAAAGSLLFWLSNRAMLALVRGRLRSGQRSLVLFPLGTAALNFWLRVADPKKSECLACRAGSWSEQHAGCGLSGRRTGLVR